MQSELMTNQLHPTITQRANKPSPDKSGLDKKISDKPAIKTELSDAELMLYARQIILPDWGIAAQLNLVNSRVVIIGMGGLGCPVAESLVRAGVGCIHLIDNDSIELSNLQRQTLFFNKDIGKPKASVAQDNLSTQNPNVVITSSVMEVTEANIADLTEDFDLIIDCTDNFGVRDCINSHCVHSNKAFISAAAIATSGQLALYDFRKENKELSQQGCYRCVFGDEAVATQACSEIGVLMTTTQIVGNLAANLALHFLGKHINSLPNKLLIWNGDNMTQKVFSYQKDNNCQVCSHI